MQNALFDDSDINSNALHQIRDGEYIFIQNFFDTDTANKYLKQLLENIEWKQESMNMFGKRIPFPRLTAWYGEEGKNYSYSGVTHQPLPWSKELLEIKQKIEEVSDTSFNSVLLNLYRNGNDSMSWHTDAEPELGRNPIIASINFGDSRNFHLRHMKTKEKIEIELTHGSLLVMQGELQHHWQHQVPKTKKSSQPRINLTFRRIK